MSVVIQADQILLTGSLGVEDAEALLSGLLDHPGYPVDIAALTSAHLAVVQLLLAAGRPLIGLGESGLLDQLPLRSLPVASP